MVPVARYWSVGSTAARFSTGKVRVSTFSASAESTACMWRASGESNQSLNECDRVCSMLLRRESLRGFCMLGTALPLSAQAKGHVRCSSFMICHQFEQPTCHRRRVSVVSTAATVINADTRPVSVPPAMRPG
jgi:hypothetical protein